VWCPDQAGPDQAKPHEGTVWRPEGDPARLPHEYQHGATTKILTLFHPADGIIRMEGATTCPNEILPPWIRRHLAGGIGWVDRPPKRGG
jgi:hypothetical protein